MRTKLAFLVLIASALMVAAAHSSTALCLPPAETTDGGANYRYAWFFVESLSHARLAWQEADGAADSAHPVIKLSQLKLAVEDFQCAASLVEPFRSTRGPDEFTTSAIQTSAASATDAYTAFAMVFHRWATRSGRGEGMSIDEAADLKVQNEKAGEMLIHAASTAGFALLKSQGNPQARLDRFDLTRAQRSALIEGLVRRFPLAGKLNVTKDTHSPDFAAEVLQKLLSNPRYKTADEP
jgi:hypothetical protein